MATNEKPQVDVPSDQPPSYQLELDDIVVGEGEEAVAGRVVEVHYVGVSWKTGRQFDASWDRGDTFKFRARQGPGDPGLGPGRGRHEGRRPAAHHHPAEPGLRQARRRRGDRPRGGARVRGGPDGHPLMAARRVVYSTTDGDLRKARPADVRRAEAAHG